MTASSDRRQQDRLKLPGTVYGSMGFSTAIHVMNLSTTGAMVELADQLSPGQPCVLSLRLPGGEVQLRAHVVWCALHSIQNTPDGEEDVRHRSGLDFIDMPESVAVEIQRFLATVSRSVGKPPEKPH